MCSYRLANTLFSSSQNNNNNMQQNNNNNNNNNFVLCGRGHANSKNPGNCKFKEIIKGSIANYIQAKSRMEKALVVATVSKHMTQDCQLQFITIDSTTNEIQELTPEKIHDKISHAIRDSMKQQDKSSKQPIKAVAAAKKRKRQRNNKNNTTTAEQHNNERTFWEAMSKKSVLPFEINDKDNKLDCFDDSSLSSPSCCSPNMEASISNFISERLSFSWETKSPLSSCNNFNNNRLSLNLFDIDDGENFEFESSNVSDEFVLDLLTEEENSATTYSPLPVDSSSSSMEFDNNDIDRLLSVLD